MSVTWNVCQLMPLLHYFDQMFAIVLNLQVLLSLIIVYQVSCTTFSQLLSLTVSCLFTFNFVPLGPGAPSGPGSPLPPGAPRSPDGPADPVGPRSPLFPLLPSAPTAPGNPRGPGAPVSPFMPNSPLNPRSPGIPCKQQTQLAIILVTYHLSICCLACQLTLDHCSSSKVLGDSGDFMKPSNITKAIKFNMQILTLNISFLYLTTFISLCN